MKQRQRAAKDKKKEISSSTRDWNWIESDKLAHSQPTKKLRFTSSEVAAKLMSFVFSDVSDQIEWQDKIKLMVMEKNGKRIAKNKWQMVVTQK